MTQITRLTITLHTGDPGQIGGMPEHEVDYPAYERVPVVQMERGWRIGRSTYENVGPFKISFHEGTRQVGQITHWSALHDGTIALVGTMDTPIYVETGVTPYLRLENLDHVFREAQRTPDLVKLIAMRGVIAASDHPARTAALRALDRIARPCRR